ncbi:MAG: carbamoyl phosphate synthase small subunit, partial [Bacteroidia bacterium]|nr:carbamoyl phosphate synthase small subunit [Bacteroidia bacterium]
KYNIMRSLAKHGCQTTVFPCTAPAEQILEMNPDGILLSPGPGDPALLGYVVETVQKLVDKKPIMGVCLGNQLLGYAFGSRTFKLKFGHRGSNHPVKNLATDRVYITSQNHGFTVSESSLESTPLEITHRNLNDQSIEGLRHKTLPAFSVQYHPEASPGPHDSRYLFDEFVEMMKHRRH